MNAHNMFVDVYVRAVINSIILYYFMVSVYYTVYCLYCVTSLYFTARTII